MSGPTHGPGRVPRSDDDPRWPRPPTAPPGAPDVLVIVTDDVGFGAASTFGGPIPTPSLDRLAAAGLRYTRFHTTAMCSPTRAALMTGRNHHRVSSGRVTEMAVAYDGYTAAIPDSAATTARVLRRNGYATAHIGKYHNVPDYETGPAGPFDRWPTGMGFDHFYGFLGGSTDNYSPALYRGTTPVEAPDDPDYHLEKDLADEAIGWIRRQKSVAPDRPVFVQYATGACHAPHHAPRAWVERFAGVFDHGWDSARRQILDRQISLGLVPPDTRLTDRPEELPAWDSLSTDRRRVAARMMEVYAAALAHSDAQVGRLLDALDELGGLDDTLVLFLQGDNGASPEGGALGTLNEMTFVNRLEDSVPELVAALDDLGGPKHYNNFPAGWAHAMDTPFQWFKTLASHFGGTRNGLVISPPARTAERGGIRDQFHHVVDIAPTIYDVVGIAAPEAVDGVAQLPLDGTSMTYSFTDPHAPSTRRTQYFELMGNAAIYHDGWVAATTPSEMPWEFRSDWTDPEQARWELYHVAEDFSQARDLAAAEPERLAELIDLFWAEAEDNGALPIVAGKAHRPGPPKPNPTAGRDEFVYHGVQTRIPGGVAPDPTNRSFTFTAAVQAPAGGGDGLLYSHGGHHGGHAVYLRAGVLTYHYNLLDKERFTVRSGRTVPPGARVLAVRFVRDTHARGSGGTVVLTCDGTEIGRGRIDRTAPWRMSYLEGTNVGAAAGTAVAPEYRVPFAFDGRITRATLTFDPTD